MIDTAIFSIFHRPISQPRPAPAPPSEAAAVPKREIAATEPAAGPSAAAAPPGWSAGLGDVAAAADQLGLANPASITLRVRLLDEPPTLLASTRAGIYRPVPKPTPTETAAAPDEAAELQTGLAKGSHILTARGEVQVEELQPGDAALAMRGPALLPITWIGRVAPTGTGVRIEAGALGSHMPRRTLRLAADHPVFIDPVPVPAHTLVNGSTIQTVEMAGSELFQIDVGSAEVLFVEGMLLSSDRRSAA